jgi:hypothetical protein
VSKSFRVFGVVRGSLHPVSIVALTVQEILDEHIAKKLM